MVNKQGLSAITEGLRKNYLKRMQQKLSQICVCASWRYQSFNPRIYLFTYIFKSSQLQLIPYRLNIYLPAFFTGQFINDNDYLKSYNVLQC
jgi:hypothetical protein